MKGYLFEDNVGTIACIARHVNATVPVPGPASAGRTGGRL
jgi:hypothetical protein